MNTPSFQARLKPPNRDYLNGLKSRFGVRSLAAALNRILDQCRVSELQPSTFVMPCPQCTLPVQGVNVNRFALCDNCRIIFTLDGSARWAMAPVKKFPPRADR